MSEQPHSPVNPEAVGFQPPSPGLDGELNGAVGSDGKPYYRSMAESAADRGLNFSAIASSVLDRVIGPARMVGEDPRFSQPYVHPRKHEVSLDLMSDHERAAYELVSGYYTLLQVLPPK